MSAYQLGVLAGKSDKRLGVRNRYAWNYQLDMPGTFTHEYGRGYRVGNTDPQVRQLVS